MELGDLSEGLKKRLDSGDPLKSNDQYLSLFKAGANIGNNSSFLGKMMESGIRKQFPAGTNDQEIKRTMNNILNVVQNEFGGDVHKAFNFLAHHGRNPDISGMDFNAFVESGKSKEFIRGISSPEQKQVIKPNPTVNIAQVIPPATPSGRIGEESFKISKPPLYEGKPGSLADKIYGKELTVNDVRILSEGLGRDEPNKKFSREDAMAVSSLQVAAQKSGSAEYIKATTQLGRTVMPSRPLAIGIDGKPVGHERPEVQSEMQQSTSQLISQGMDNGRFNFMNQPRSLLDANGRLDLNGDGVGGLRGLIKALIEKSYSSSGNSNIVSHMSDRLGIENGPQGGVPTNEINRSPQLSLTRTPTLG